MSVLVPFMNRTPEVAEFLDGWESVIQFDLEGEEPFALEFKGGKSSLLKGRIRDPDVTIYCDSETFFEIMVGKVSQDDAFATGLVQISGSITDSVRFRHAAEITQRNHSAPFSALRALSRFT